MLALDDSLGSSWFIYLNVDFFFALEFCSSSVQILKQLGLQASLQFLEVDMQMAI